MDDMRCKLDEFLLSDGKPIVREFYTDCPNDGRNYTFCRVITQNVKEEVSIIRECGYIAKTGSDICYKTETSQQDEYNTKVCECFQDGCNGGLALQIPTKSGLIL